MCRMLGIVASEPTDFRLCLHQGPRNLGLLSREHPDGWGIAVHSKTSEWCVQKEVACAGDDARFHEAAAGSRGETLVAHIRKRTVGMVALENTHPFHRGRWVFAHNGTIDEMEYLRSKSSPTRLCEVAGSTDSELFFAFLLTQIDKAGSDSNVAAVDAILTETMRAVGKRSAMGACNFLLSDGRTLYAYRHGRTLFALERRQGDEARMARESVETGAVIETPWTLRRHAILIASEQITDEPWEAVDDGTLLRVARRPEPELSVLSKG
jgi:predicted glutamine amidotransferase